jgi:iron complex outermembrane recepter protein
MLTDFYMKNLTTYLLVCSLFFQATAQQTADSLRGSNLTEVTIKATRTTEKSGMAFSNIYKKELQKQNLGQDLPYLLNALPSVVVSSDAGGGVGYTGIRVRGTDPTRINVTFNGVPQNDAESQGLYWVNTPDLASSVSSIQVQRGVGTSTNGGSAFGASINVNTIGLENERFLETNASYGSFNTSKFNFKTGSGLLKNGLTFDLRLSNITSDGYIERAESDLKSLYGSVGYYKRDNFVRAIAIIGHERTYQAWEGVSEEMLKTNRRFNPYTYEDQVDNYNQGNYQLVGSFKLANALRLNSTLHYTRGKGYYEQFRAEDNLENYGGRASVNQDLVRRKWLDNHFYGLVYSLDYEPSKSLSMVLGGGINQYLGNHFGEVIKAPKEPAFKAFRWYESDATKNDFNVFGKTTYQFSKVFNTFVDMQIRSVGYDFSGTGDKMQLLDNESNYTFFNPKIGLNAQFENGFSTYASYAVGNKEPSRQDFVDNAPTTPKPENLQDFEVGIRVARTALSGAVNFYNMQYRDQLVLTGAVNGTGDAIRVNVPESYRRGVEFELSAGYNLLRVAGNLTLSQNKIKNFQETVVDYDTGNNIVKNFKSTDISFSPNVVAGGQISLTPIHSLEISLLPKYVGRQFLDNTSSLNKRINPYFLTDIRINFTPQTSGLLKQLRFDLLVNNVFNRLYESNGYTYSYVFDRQLSVNNFYYPQAGTNFLLGCGFRF